MGLLDIATWAGALCEKPEARNEDPRAKGLDGRQRSNTRALTFRGSQHNNKKTGGIIGDEFRCRNPR